ncbi:hypothetical protein [Pontimicrobium sp. MEBiC01747]
MRTIQITVAMIICILFQGCSDTEVPTTHYLSVAIDQTEKDRFKVPSDPIIKQLKTTALHDGITLSLIPISETRYTQKQSFVLTQGETALMANEDLRRGKRRALFTSFQKALAILNANDTERTRSDIFRTVAKELNELAQKEGKRTLVVSSDLQSHNDIFSVHNRLQLQQLYTNPKAVKKRFESATTLADNLQGITVIIAYNPSLKDEKLFSHLVALYRSILEPRGAIVHVGFDNTTTL